MPRTSSLSLVASLPESRYDILNHCFIATGFSRKQTEKVERLRGAAQVLEARRIHPDSGTDSVLAFGYFHGINYGNWGFFAISGWLISSLRLLLGC